MKGIKEIIKRIVGKKNIYHINYSKNIYHKLYKNDTNMYKKMKCILKTKIFKDGIKKTKFEKLFKRVKLIDIDRRDKFYYSIDIYKTICISNKSIGNLSIDYEKILKNSLIDYKQHLEFNKKNEDFYKNEIKTIEGIEVLIDRIVDKLKKQNADAKIVKNIENIKDKTATCLQEALQRILFFNQLLWQTNHRLNGLGRLDLILNPYYEKDIDNNIINKEEAKELIKNFLEILHRDYSFKSNMLMGDTGQVIELGGKNIHGDYECNELTYMFIEIMKELNLPDPKLLLRISENMPRKLMQKSLECISTGIGCPLFANDDVIIDKLIKFGYKEEDAYNYGTSACWEPFIIGKSLDQNNIKSIVFIKPFETLLEEENLNTIKNKEELIALYKKHLEKYIDNFIKQSENVIWEEDPILSLLTDNCIKNNKDISKGGAIYNNYGFTGVGISNLVNSIINIDDLVFKNKEYTFNELNKIRKNNYKDNSEILGKLKGKIFKYGTDNEYVLEIANEIIEYTTKIMKQYTNPLGGKYKFGLSAPSYIDESKNFPASFDGRKYGEPFGVHISSDISNAYTELIQFASKLNYNENRFNGNVVDFMVSPDFINNNFEKFVDFLMLSIKVGFFEMQINVVSSKILIEARKDPEKFPNLIVRVWGFSSYFKDLPDEYKDYLIERAIKSESNS